MRCLPMGVSHKIPLLLARFGESPLFIMTELTRARLRLRKPLWFGNESFRLVFDISRRGPEGLPTR